jgi:glycosyltransferase involved in cell wall biosynthesis
VSVVVITHNRASRLSALLESLSAQTLGSDAFEVVVIDDGSADETPELLVRAAAESNLTIRAIRRDAPPGRSAARNAGWRAASSPLIAYIDAEHPGSILQGRVDPIPAEVQQSSPGTRTQRIHSAGPYYQTCNIFYPRELIEQLGGFDEDAYRLHGGEDTDLAWRGITAGVATAYAESARAYHAVNHLGLIGRLRFASHWHESMLVYKRYPELREAVFTKRIFWKESHYGLLRLAVAVMLPRRLAIARPYLIRPYLRNIQIRRRAENGSLAHVAFYPIEDAVELIAMVRASIRHRMLVL